MDGSSQNGAVDSIHIGNLSHKTTVSELQELFSTVAKPKHITIGGRAGASSTFGFATFENREECLNVIKTFNYYSLHNKQMNLVLYEKNKKNVPESNLFVKNLPLNLNSKDLHEIFRIFGEIKSCKVASDANGNLKGYGYVQYASAKAAKRAMENCQNVKIGDNLLDVELYNEKKHENRKSVLENFTNCYIKNIPAFVDENKLRSVLEKYGEIVSLLLPLNSDGKPIGHAYANFSTHAGAVMAIGELHGKTTIFCDDTTICEPFYIQRWESKEERKDITQKLHDFSLPKKQHSRGNLYVSNIPYKFPEKAVLDLFSKYGNIIDYKIDSSVSQSRQSKFGYICYETNEEASLAHERLNGSMIDNNKLNVSFYKSKLERFSEKQNKSYANISEGKSLASDKSNNSSEKATPESNLSEEAKSHIKYLYTKLLKKSEEWKPFWNTLKVTNNNAFALALTLSITRSPFFSVPELAYRDDLLNTYIEKYVNDKNRFTKQQFITKKDNSHISQKKPHN